MALLVPFLALAALILAIGTATAGVSVNSGFEGDDGNLVDDTTPSGIDWNTFKTTAWTGTAPYQTTEKTASGWKFVGIADAQNDGDDTAFAGGTKQDDECATVKFGPKPPNKDDLERIYVASKVDTGVTPEKVYLALAWVRIPQNTTSASAHVAFEFNQLDPDVTANQCGGDSDGLVKRSTANDGDVLVVYDFEGGSTELPVIKILRWIGSGSCEVGSSSPPCWGNGQIVTALGFAEAKVNVGETALDEIAPTSETLGDSEFGEAIIDLSGAGVFPTVGCLTFGSVFGVSRSSGNSAQAQMKDLVGPGDSGLSNCGKIELVKDFVGAPSNARANLFIHKGGTTTLVDQEPNAGDLGTTGKNEVRAGAYDISETQGTNTLFSNYSTTVACVDEAPTPDVAVAVTSPSLTGTGTTPRSGTVQVPVLGDVKCTFTNTLLTGAIQVTKTGGDKRCLGAGNPDATCVSAGVRRLTGVTFQLKKGSTVIGNMAETSTTGVYCTQGLVFGSDYTIQETAAPTGYTIDNGAVSSPITINTSSTCASGAVSAGTYTNTPVSKIQVKFFPPAPGVTVASIDCGTTTAGTELSPTPADSDESTNPVPLNDSDETYEQLAPGTYYCKVVIDP